MPRAYHAATTTTYTSCRHLSHELYCEMWFCYVHCTLYTVQVCISIHMYIVLYTCGCVSTYKMIQNWYIAETVTSHIFATVPL